MKHDYEQIKLMIKAIGMIPAHDLGDSIAFYAPSRTGFKVAVVLLDKKEIEEKGGYRVVNWDDIEPLDLVSSNIEIAATETRQSFMLDMSLFQPRNEIPLQLY
jgi:hypothetical protein